jgi:hypothetical protein
MWHTCARDMQCMARCAEGFDACHKPGQQNMLAVHQGTKCCAHKHSTGASSELELATQHAMTHVSDSWPAQVCCPQSMLHTQCMAWPDALPLA